MKYRIPRKVQRDQDNAQNCEDIKLKGRYQPFSKKVSSGIPKRGAKFTLKGVALIPKCQATLNFRNRSASKAWYWGFDDSR